MHIVPQDKIVVGNWMNDTLVSSLHQQFDVVLADYLIGAVEGHAPYQQEQVVERLARFLKPGGVLYLVGAEPLASATLANARLGDSAAARYAATNLMAERCSHIDWFG
jgi:chemotaxis methyl-accepting protein methylase